MVPVQIRAAMLCDDGDTTATIQYTSPNFTNLWMDVKLSFGQYVMIFDHICYFRIIDYWNQHIFSISKNDSGNVEKLHPPTK